MIDSPVSAVILEGTPHTSTPIEEMVRRVRHAVIRDNLKKFRDCDAVHERILATNDRSLAESVDTSGLTVSFCDFSGDFHFGRHLTSIINRHCISRIFYMGGGAGPFLTPGEIERICSMLMTRERVLLPNNFFSSDFVAFTPADIVNSLRMPRVDNTLAYVLREEGSLDLVPIEPSSGTVFDIDTPSDVMVLSLCPGLGRSAEETVRSLNLQVQSLRDIIPVMRDRNAEVLIYGRLNPHIFGRLESKVQCRLRVFSEERGMKARGRIERGEVQSFIGHFLEEVGVEKFFERISTFCDGAFIDSRVIFAHLRKRVSKMDRFLSDYGDYEAIGDEFVRKFTREAQNASIPVILGGHSLLSGGLWVMGDIVGRAIEEGEGGGTCRSSADIVKEKES